MENQESELIEKIRQQFDNAPYPRIPLEQSPKKDYELLYIHNLVTAYYLRNQQVIETEGKVILDAGCGTGYKSLVLAEANPGSRIVGIDLSEESVKLAQKRLQYHGFENAEFHALCIEELPKLELKFDYINSDEVIYLLPDIKIGLSKLKSVIKPHGIIRTNFHSSLQRAVYFRAQEVFKMMGLMEENPRELEIEIAREILTALKDDVMLKIQSWDRNAAQTEEWMLMNYLFQGDKGYTIPEMFSALRATDLEFVSMVNWRRWDLLALFKEQDNLPAFLAMSLPETSVEERLHLFELLHPVNRLIDFWCAHPNQAQSFVPVDEWTLSDWEDVRVHLHPQLKSFQATEDLIHCINSQKPFEISRYVPLPALVPIIIESHVAACLLPLWESPCPAKSLMERWLKLKPLHPVTMQPASEKTAWDEIKEVLSRLEAFLYLLLERSARPS
ncbi:MAG: class I SAM-dependent methyltransferase [Microcoleus sp. PH2017_10_PVI_O_A]|uniref:class I SAM-dependent methyltransferase n=1 Tax=unclassified Microcoleus TaxID=2642155 RepID=UPI001DB3D2D6|nr:MULTISPECIES: class I SAM-dependent methyltransferase [unclassified Microcoleus]TAE82923.1 MAG: class I SAM-dependent methyltransferase [Oscillatoriales cyanobacterium]MCC3406147.1 class I SAM-dependent methyltransferase [Microcoleus sp. PH2017_10_PVI_O_A]MCC3460555.1 class I SAM-dependent methyltransferase [Microcoleus sp. PH2017_11_PCY_U_A]MCC3479048.1 class I SAM-dependent methyltransferase [Microcoleus sp. PH2017_12_PCY_D_A]MCC3559945.1 class I SAM-dependent methyltransferase [Microcole